LLQIYEFLRKSFQFRFRYLATAGSDHRVARGHRPLTAPDLISVGGQEIPVSRKYKESVKAAL
jgi:hypothetical protein